MAQTVVTRQKCVRHPEDDAWVTCRVCAAPLCTMCIHGLDPDRPVCRQCSASASTVDYLGLLGQVATVLPFLLAAGLTVLLKTYLALSWPAAILIAFGTSFLFRAKATMSRRR